jgi:hypothetical protein
MDPARKNQLRSELMVIKTLNSGINGLTGVFNQINFPVTGPIVIIPPLTNISMLVRNQTDVVERLASLIDKLLDEI